MSTPATLTINAVAHQSPPFRLIPGLRLGDKLLDECVVKLLTRLELKELAVAREQAERDKQAHQLNLNPPDDIELMLCIARLGEVTDKNVIRHCLDHLTDVDEARIKSEYVKLQRSCFPDTESDTAAQPTIRKLTRQTDIVSEPFDLNPGIEIGGALQRTAIVRLARRGEYKLIGEEPDPVRRADLDLFFSIVQFGDCLSFTMEDLDQLTDPDQERIYRAVEELRARHAPRPKSEEEESA